MSVRANAVRPTAVSRTVGEAVRAVRTTLSLSQTELAVKVSRLGYPVIFKTISDIETGTRAHVDVDLLMALSEALFVDPMALITGTVTEQIKAAAAARRLESARAELEAAERDAATWGVAS